MGGEREGRWLGWGETREREAAEDEPDPDVKPGKSLVHIGAGGNSIVPWRKSSRRSRQDNNCPLLRRCFSLSPFPSCYCCWLLPRLPPPRSSLPSSASTFFIPHLFSRLLASSCGVCSRLFVSTRFNEFRPSGERRNAVTSHASHYFSIELRMPTTSFTDHQNHRSTLILLRIGDVRGF